MICLKGKIIVHGILGKNGRFREVSRQKCHFLKDSLRNVGKKMKIPLVISKIVCNFAP